MNPLADDLSLYRPSDALYLWWLAQPERPILVGTLMTVRANQGVSLRYAPAWLKSGFALSEDLPLRDIEFMPHDKETAAGAVDDARPDRWGERVIRWLDKPPRLSLLDYLFYAGDERFGALGVSVSEQTYLPRRLGPLPHLGDVSTMAELIQNIINGAPVAPHHRRLMAPGVTLGGARPKALIELEGAPWIVKFAEPGDVVDTPLVEHAAMTLAATAGIRVATTRPIALPRGHALAVQRFDREGRFRRHALSARVALKAAGSGMGYPELAQLLRRRGVVQGGVSLAQQRELFRRMVFNILIDNTDDHEKNHALLMTDACSYELAPAFDVLPCGQGLGYQQMRVGSDMADATLTNALSEAAQFGLAPREAQQAVHEVAAVVAQWQSHFAAKGVTQTDREQLAQQIDRPFLREQREAALTGQLK
jgi:serine/threonine-protein kinase HipA